MKMVFVIELDFFIKTMVHSKLFWKPIDELLTLRMISLFNLLG